MDRARLPPRAAVVELGAGTGIASSPLGARGYLALVWTDVTSWGEDLLEARLATICGAPCQKRLERFDVSLRSVRDDPRFDAMEIFHHRSSENCTARRLS